MTKHRMPMSAPMIRAIQRELWIGAGYGKTQTRRVVKPQPTEQGLEWATACGGEFAAWQDPGLLLDEHSEDGGPCQRIAPYGQPGDLLAFTETFAFGAGYDELPPREVPASPYVRRWYQADVETPAPTQGRWRNSRFMPYWVSRYTGVVTDVRVQRVQEISEDDAVAEGLPPMEMGRCKYVPTSGERHRAAFRFRELWDTIHGPDAWDRNDWVWVYTFRPIQANVLDVERDPAAYGVGEVVA